MRVIHVSPTAFGAIGLFGGGERYPVELVRALARQVDCRLVTFGSQASTRNDDGVTVEVLRAPLLLGGHPAHPVPRRLLERLDDADIVHAHHLRALPSRVSALAAWSRDKRRVVTDHGLGRGRGPQVLARLFDRFLTVSRYSAKTLGSPVDKTNVVYGGADTGRFHPGLSDARSGVLFVGRLTPHKGVDRLIEALPPGAGLTIVGTAGHDRRAPERDYPRLLKELARDRNVRFVDRVVERELPSLYRRAKVLVLPSVHETCYGKRVGISELLGLSLLEAMASGTPVIASRIGGLPEVVVDGQTGFVVESGDVAALRQRIAELLAHDGLAATLGDNARQHVLDNFTWDRCAERCLAAYEELMRAV